MAQLFSNVARAELSAGISATDTTFTISSGGALFPVANTGASAISDAADWFKVVFQDGAGIEIAYVRTHTSSSTSFSDVIRGQEGTTARIFATGSVVGLRMTAADAAEWEASVDGPASSTDNAIVRFDGTTGKLIQNSTATIDDSGNAVVTSLNTDYIDFDTAATPPASAVGRLTWDSGDGSLVIGLKGGNAQLQVGQEEVVLVYNNSASTITVGQVVAINGAQGARPAVVLADADSEPLSAATLGMAVESISAGTEGYISTFGVVRGVDTSAFSAGNPVYLSQTAGTFTATRPSAPAHTVFLGWVVKVNASSGEIFLNINNGWELDELHNVLISGSPSTGQSLVYNATSGVWQNSNAPVLSSATGLPLSTGVTGTLAVANGGTGITSGTSGGVPYFSSSSAIASSSALTANALVIGGGAGAAPATTTTGTGVLTALGNAVNATGGVVTVDGSATLTSKTLSSSTLSGTTTGSDGLLTRVMLQDTGWDYFDSNTTSALDYVNGSHQRWAPSGTVSLTVTNWPPSGALGELLIEGVNLGAATITWPTINWIKSDGTTTTTFASNGVTMQSSGTDWFILWTRDAGTTIYGKFVR